MADRYEELKESGKLNSFMNKKRKRNSNKDHRHVPRRRAEE
jgi:ribosomal RNA-processing protein 36